MPNPYRDMLAQLDATGPTPTPPVPTAGNPYRQMLAQLDEPQQVEQPKESLPWTTGVVGRNARAGVFTGVNALAGIPAAIELAGRNLVGADLPGPDSNTPLAGYLARQKAMEQEAQAASTYDESLLQKTVGGGVQTMSNPLNALLPVAAGTQAAMRTIPLAQQATMAPALQAATTAGGISAGTQAAIDSSGDGRLETNEAINALVQGIIETKMGRTGGQIGEFRRLPGSPGEEVANRAVDVAADTIVRNPVQEGATGLAQETAEKALLEGRLPTGQEATEATVVSAGAGGMQSAAANAPGLVADTVSGALDRRASGNEAIARAMAQAFDPSNAQPQQQAEGPGPVTISPEVAAEAKANPALLDLLTPSQIAEGLATDQPEAGDQETAANELRAELNRADDTAIGERSLRQADDEALRQQELREIIDNEIGTPRDTQAQIELDREQEALSRPDVEAESARQTLADQERVQRENEEREQRRTAFRVREDILAAEAGTDVGTHIYDDTGKLSIDSERPNHFLSLPPEKRAKAIERARRFVRHHLGDDEGAMAADDPTVSAEAARFRMQEKPLPAATAAGVRTGSPSPELTAAEIVAMPAKERAAAFSALPQESRLRLQPEITRLIQEQKRIHGFNEPAAVPPASPEQLMSAKGKKQPPKPLSTQQVEPAAQPKRADTGIPVTNTATETGNPVTASTAPEPAKPANAAAPSPAQPSEAPTPPPVNRKEIGRLARVSKAVLPSSVKVDEADDHIRITYPGGASVQVRPVDTVPLDPAAWFDSVAKVRGAVSSAFSRAGFGATAPTKAQWLKLPKARQQAVMAELPPVAAVSDISGGRVGLSRDALVRLVQPQQRTDAQLANVIEEEDHHVVFSALLTNEERTTVRDELARSRSDLAKEDPASRAVMEAAYEHWRTWNQDRQKAAVSPKVAGVFGKLLARIKAMLRWFARTPTVTGKTAAGVWENLGAVRERSEVTPAAKAEQAESDDANAVLIPKDESLRGSDLRKQWQKATGERPAKTESFQELARKADKVDRAKGREVAYAVPQALNDIMPPDQAQSFEQWQKEADAILADEARLADVRARALADVGLSPAEQIALRRLVGEQLAEAAASGNQNRWTEAMETAALRKASGARVAREMAARRLDLSTPEGRRELMLNHVAEMGRRWQSAFNRAKTKRDRNAAAARWQKQQQRIFKTLKDRFGIDLTDPRVGEIFSDAYSVGQLLDTVSDVAGDRFHFGRLVGYYVAGNLLGGAAVAANTTGYPLMLGMQAFKAVPAMIARAVMKSDNQNLTSAQGAWAAAHAGVKAIGRGITNGAVSFWTGRPQANRQVDPTGGSEDDANRMVAPIKNPFARLALAPFLEVNRFMDEMAWTIGYNGALAAVASERKQAGDQRSHRELIESPDADMIERAVRWADWFTLRGTGNKAADAALQKLSTVREASPKWLEDAVDSVAPGAGTFAVNPLYFVMPFFKTIAVLTVEGAKLTTPPLMAAVAVKRGVDALRADTKEGKQEAGAAALKATAYTLAGLVLMGLAQLKGEDDEPLVKGSPSDGKSSGERSTRFAVEEPRTIAGVDYSRLDPVAMPMSLHADFRDAMQDLQDGKPAGAVFNKLGEKAWNAAVQRQFLQGLDNLFRPQYDEEGQPKGMTEKFTESVSGQLAPGRPWISTARRLTETERMERPKGEIARVYDAGRPARNIFGEREQTRDDTAGAAIAGLFFPPRGKASEEAQDWQKTIYELNAEVEKAGGKTWWPNPMGRTYQTGDGTARWTDEQYDRVREIAGSNWLELLRDSKEEMGDPDLSASDRLEFIQRMRERANRLAVRAVRTE